MFYFTSILRKCKRRASNKRKITVACVYLTNKISQNKINPFISITNSLPLLSNSTTFSQPEYLETNNQTKLYCMHLEDTPTSAIILSLSLSRRGEDRKREDEL